MTPYKHIKYLCQYIEENRFSLPAGFREKSVPYLARHYNGIGAEWMPAKLRKFVTALLRHMEPAALVHDVDYLSNNKSYLNFTKANLRLFYNGIKSRYFFSGFALSLICQIFGWTAWKEGKETMAYYYHFKEDNNGTSGNN
jgi:hypothetical protein